MSRDYVDMANEVLSSPEPRSRALAGLVLGTTWRDTTDGRELNVSSARIESEAGDEFISLKHDYGSQSAEDFYTEILVGNYTPESANADHAYAIVKGLENAE